MQGKRGRGAARGDRTQERIYQKKKSAYFGETAEIQAVIARYSQTDFLQCESFSDYPLSRRTLDGLQASGFKEPTDIQRQTIGLALQGSDILGAAKTGSGKTLAFVIPLLELLWRHRWSPHVDGLGALIITPTRELAYQIFEVIRKVGSSHDFSAALLVGGNHVGYERARIGSMNIAVGTPGRLLQHMDTSPNFDTTALKILVLDEADRCLDMGFERQLNAIVDNLPKDRQTLLFSATQTKSVKDLARLSLKDPVYVSAHEKATHSTPDSLVQNYLVSPDEEKVNFLFSFLRSHIGQKILVFMTSCRQVRFMAEAFVKLRTGVKVLCLHGKVNPSKRVKVYEHFCKQTNVALFATDVAARGLDFPAVDWVVQLDCPCDAAEYIHRAGRTARYASKGRALLVLTPSQKDSMLEQLAAKRIPITGIKPDRRKLFNASAKLQSILAQDANLKAFAQRCVVSYMKSIVMMPNKEVFNAKSVNVEAFAQSLGLLGAPRVRFMRKQQQQQPRADATPAELQSDVQEQSFGANAESDDDDDADDALFTLKKPAHENEEDFDVAAPGAQSLDDLKPKSVKLLTKRALAKKTLRQLKKVPNAPAATGAKIVFRDSEGEDSDGKQESQPPITSNPDPAQQPSTSASSGLGGIDLSTASREMREADAVDKLTHRERMKALKRERKRRLKLKTQKGKRPRGDGEDEVEVHLGSGSDDGDGPDLSWLPDPDQRKSKGDDDEFENDRDASTSSTSKGKLSKAELLAKKLLGIG